MYQIRCPRYISRTASVGYARVSTREQHAEGQTDVLDASGCEKVFVGHTSGMLATRPALIEALGYLRRGVSVAGDDAVVVRA